MRQFHSNQWTVIPASRFSEGSNTNIKDHAKCSSNAGMVLKGLSGAGGFPLVGGVRQVTSTVRKSQ